MPITVYTTPSNSSSLANEMLFVAFEGTKAYDETTYPDYRYVLDLYISGVLVQRQKVRPRPDNRLGIFDVSTVLRDYVTYGLSISASKVDYDAKISYTVKFGEEYSDTLYTNLVVDGVTYTAFKTYAKRPFTTSAIIANGLASNMPRARFYHNNQPYMLFPVYNSGAIADAKLDLKDADSATTSTQTLTNSDYTPGQIRQFNFGQTFADTVDSVNFYGAGIGDAVKLKMLCANKYPAYTLAWLNPFGGYESQSFGLVSKKTIEIERKDFTRLNYELNVSGVVSYDSNNVFYGGKRGFSSVAKTKMLFTSHLLSDAEYTWLAELFASTDVYLYDSDKSKFHPVTITDNSYEYRTYKNSQLTPLQFNVEFSDQYNSQFL
jgi:hypothetical protein